MKLLAGLIFGVPAVVYSSDWLDTMPAEILGAGFVYVAMGAFVCMGLLLIRSTKSKRDEPLGRNGKMRELLNRSERGEQQ